MQSRRAPILLSKSRKKQRSTSPYTKATPSTIAIVGNGPISKKDVHKINKCDCVFRCNHARHFKPGRDKIDYIFNRIHIFGPYNSSYNSSDKFIKKNSNLSFEVIDVGTKQLNAGKRHHLFTYNSKKNKYPKNRDLRVFKSCNFCHNNNKCLHRSSLLGPTTGLMGIEFVSTTYPNATIHLFGFNWCIDFKSTNPNNGHMLHEKEIIRRCCKNCIVHRTPRSTYR